MYALNMFITLAMFYSLHGSILCLTCLNCDDCAKVIEVSEICKGNHVNCISYVDDKKVVKRCGTLEECESVGNPSPNHSQYTYYHQKFVEGLVEFGVATLDSTTFRENDSYCCDSDLCDYQSVSTLNDEEYSSDVTEPLEDVTIAKLSKSDVTEPQDQDGNSKETTDGDIMNTGNFSEESLEYGSGTTLRKPHRIGYNSPKLRSKARDYTTEVVNYSDRLEKRSRKRSSDNENADESEELKNDENDITIGPKDETTLLAQNYSGYVTSSTVVVDSSTVTETSDGKGNAEPVSNGIRSLVFGEYILIPLATLYIFW